MRRCNFLRLMFNKVTSRSYVTSSSSHIFFGREMDSSK
jgi:hypothetical protein